MLPLPKSLRVFSRAYTGTAGGYGRHGAVYLLKCRRSGLCKFGASHNPHRRISGLVSYVRRHGYDLEYIWSIATNDIYRLETHWRREWDLYRVDHRKEWVYLPDLEIARFSSTGPVLLFKGCKVHREWINIVKGPFKYRRRQKYDLAAEITVPGPGQKNLGIPSNRLDTTSE